MRRTIFLLVICILAMCVPAQAEHLKFMGIPLTGTIAQFQQRLAAKGIKYDKGISQQLPAGVRMFNGTFAGEKAQFYIYYDPSSKIVYKAKTVSGFPDANSCNTRYEELKSSLSTKYSEAETETYYENGHESFYYRLYDKGNPSGVICIYVSNNSYSYPFNHEVNIEYIDYVNYLKNDDSKMDDL